MPVSPISSSPIRSGSNGADVRELQKALETKGFDPKGVDGQFGGNTRAAVMAFQQANGLKADGIVGTRTRAALFGNAPAAVTPAAPKPVDRFQPAAPTAPTLNNGKFVPGNGIGSGEPSIDLNGTKYTAIEGRAADNNISIHLLKSRKDFDPLKDPGVALTTSQAKALGVKVGDKVVVHDRLTGKNVVADYYDGAGTKPDGMKHMEMDPALADLMGVNYRNKKGQVVDAVTNSGNLRGRYEILPYKP
jgi:peptidoglycan hydrolase-like protein with peptidoglycan-binding domain